MVFECDCGALKKSFKELNDVLKDLLCPMCSTKLRERLIARQTKLESFLSLSEDFLTSDRGMVLDELRRGEGTDREITSRLKLSDPNKVRPRRKELVDMKLVKELYKRECKVSGKTAVVWGVT